MLFVRKYIFKTIKIHSFLELFPRFPLDVLENVKIFSSVKDRINSTGHAGSLDDFNIIAKASREFDLLIFESLLIA